MKLTTRETAVFAMLGAAMYASKVLMDALPNIHLLGMFIVALTVVYRKKALYPIYIFVFLTGLFNGFNTWWLAYLYTWAVLWGMTMLLPKKMPKAAAPVVYCIISSIHGFLYGILCAPVWALFSGMDFKAAVAWVLSGTVFDITHGVSNLIWGVMIVPLIKVLTMAEKHKNL